MYLAAFVYTLAAFLMGGIPFGYLVGRVVLHDDIRRHGSGNIGATNVWRVLGWKYGTLVLVLDAFKGLIPTACSEIALRGAGIEPPTGLMVFSGLAAVAGHMFPIWLGFRGGKGVATALGVAIVIAPKSAALSLIAFVVVFVPLRMVSLSSITAAVVYGVSHLILQGSEAWSPNRRPGTLFALVVPALIVWRHRSNIRRILNGTENRLGRSSKPPEPPTDAP